jgi:hypothetical protein
MERGIPIRFYLLAVFNYPYPDRGILPDFEVLSNIKDILSKKDTQLEFVLNFITSKKK